ncbi:pilus assembly protein [Streptomyces sp. SP17BM10]|uniref:TadE family protein n=1 Tax=Streptomyces sp. SP17BM10 TaxID=3002530 RepID=UPI002E78469F|nr:TadE family protein [Streptomyces sp. SP17BM10]MEE1782708.1 pilus assembly protein [Streptomyces sp. SP17BM10]
MTLRKLTRRRDEGSASIEAAILVPVLMLFIAMAFMAGRIALAGQGIDSAAEDAARDASIARNPDAAAAAAASAARNTLAQQGLHCQGTPSVSVAVNMGPTGTGGTVTATVVCNVALSDLAFPGAPGSHTLRSTFTSAIDRFVER